MTVDQQTDHVSKGQQGKLHSLPPLRYFFFSHRTFGFARHTSRPFAKSKEPNFQPHRKKFSERHTLAFHASTFVAEVRNIDCMQTNNLTLSQTSDKPFELDKTSSKMTISEVFAERKGSYLNEFTLFVAHFNSIPNFIHEVDIDCKKANNWFSENFKSEIKDFYYDKRYFNRSKKAEIDDIFYFLYDDLIVDFDTNCSTVRFLYVSIR